MCVNVYIHTHVIVYAYLYVYTSLYMNVYVCVFMHIYKCIHMHIYKCIYNTYIYTYTYIHMYICMYIYIYTCIHVYIYIYMYMNIRIMHIYTIQSYRVEKEPSLSVYLQTSPTHVHKSASLFTAPYPSATQTSAMPQVIVSYRKRAQYVCNISLQVYLQHICASGCKVSFVVV